MVSILAVAGLAVVLGLHTAIAALLTRFFRVHLHTTWGTLLYTALVVPFVLLVSTILMSGVLRIGPDLGGAEAALFVMVIVPFFIGVTIDYAWMPSPGEVDLPDTLD